MKSKRNIILALLTALICLGAEPSRGSVLSDTANGMAPGTWATLNTIGMNEDYLQLPGGNGHGSTEFMQQAVWDSQGRKVLFVGAGHFNAPMMHIYTESTNQWTKGAQPPTHGHAYGHNAINVAGRMLGYTSVRPDNVGPSFYNIDTNTWTIKTGGPNDGAISHSWVYFPERDRWYYIDGIFGKIREYNFNTDSWSVAATHGKCFAAPGEPQVGWYNQFSAYSPARHEIVFGGGVAEANGVWTSSRSSCRMEANGTVTVNPVAPTDLGIPAADSDNALMTVDPVTGDLLVMTQHGQLYALNFSTNTWTLIPNHATMPPLMQEASNNVSEGFVVPIDTYGVVLYFDYKRPAGGLYLYKHAQGGATVTPPMAEQTNSGNGAGGPSSDLIPPSPPTNLILVQSENPPTPLPPALPTENPSGAPALLGTAFSDLCQQSTTIYCQDFNETLPVDDIRFTEYVSSSHGPCATLETNIHADCPKAVNGELRFRVPSQSNSGGSGSYTLKYSNFLPNQQPITFGEEIFIQWKQKFDAAFLNTDYAPGSGWKQAITGTPNDHSCSINHLTVQNTNMRGYAQMYHACGFSEGFEVFLPPADIDLQPGGPATCSYTDSRQGTISPGCIPYFPDEWMTFQIGITHGQPGQNTRIRLWIAREGQPSTLAIDYFRVLYGEDQGYGLLTLLPYHTNKDESQVTPEAFVYYDQLIISHTQIPDY